MTVVWTTGRLLLSLTVGIAAITLIIIFGAQFSTEVREAAAGPPETVLTAPTVSLAEPEYEQLLRDKQTLDLALEFGFNPLIVEVVRETAGKTLAEGKESNPFVWRFVPNEEFLSYLFLSIVRVESGGDIGAVGDSNTSFGLAQIQVPTARAYEPDITRENLLDLSAHIRVAFLHLNSLMEAYDGNFALTVLSWNRGQTAVNRAIAMGESPENGYARRVFEAAARRNTLYTR